MAAIRWRGRAMPCVSAIQPLPGAYYVAVDPCRNLSSFIFPLAFSLAPDLSLRAHRQPSPPWSPSPACSPSSSPTETAPAIFDVLLYFVYAQERVPPVHHRIDVVSLLCTRE
ncbi:hypothetical protein ZWY2020_008972 [Hordeum vulgare]|nr:hypothetical protein ZWY2020_008972 [Hordeum vulgare]